MVRASVTDELRAAHHEALDSRSIEETRGSAANAFLTSPVTMTPPASGRASCTGEWFGTPFPVVTRRIGECRSVADQSSLLGQLLDEFCSATMP